MLMSGDDLCETLARWLPKASQHQSGRPGATFGISISSKMEDPCVTTHIRRLRGKG